MTASCDVLLLAMTGKLSGLCTTPTRSASSRGRDRSRKASEQADTRSPAGDSPGSPGEDVGSTDSPQLAGKEMAVRPAAKVATLSLGTLVREEKRLEGRREELRKQLAQVLDASPNEPPGTNGAARRGDSGRAPALQGLQPAGPCSTSSPCRSTVDSSVVQGTSSRELEDQIRRMQEEWQKEREMWAKSSNSDVEEAARSSAQEAEKMLGAWRKAAAKGRDSNSEQQTITGEVQQPTNKQSVLQTTHAATQTAAEDETTVPVCVQPVPTRNIDGGPLSLKQLTTQQAQQDRLRWSLKAKLALALDPRTAQNYCSTAEEMNRKVYRLEARIKQMQEERERELTTWKRANEAAVEQAQKQCEEREVTLRKERSEGAATVEALQQELSRFQETFTALQRKSSEQAVELGTRAQTVQRLTDQLRSARQETAALTEQNVSLESHMETLKAKHHSLQTQLSEVKSRATQLETALQDLTNERVAERTSTTLRLSRVAVQNACRHAVRIHESRREVKVLRDRHEGELAAVESSWQGGHELNAFLHETASKIDDELARQRIVAAVAQKIHWRRVMKSLYSWRGYAKSRQEKRHRMRQSAKQMGRLVAMKTVRAWADLIRTIKSDGKSAALQSAKAELAHERRCVESRATTLEANSRAHFDTLLGHIATKLEQSSTIQATLIQDLRLQAWTGGTMRDELLATTLVERVFSTALVREATETSQERVLVATAQKTKTRALAKCIKAWCDATSERKVDKRKRKWEQTERPGRHTEAQQHDISVRAREHDRAHDEVLARSLVGNVLARAVIDVADTLPSQMSPSSSANILDSDGARLAALKAGITECSERLSALERARTLA
eukprot:COSAG02_NODE_58_length_43613_cov_235.901572_14_plen_847_part_00